MDGRLLGVVGGTLRHALLDVQSNMTPPDAKKFHHGMVVFHRNILEYIDIPMRVRDDYLENPMDIQNII